MSLDRRKLLKLLGGAAAAWPLRTLAQQPAPARKRPNFIIMMTDDQRADAMSVARREVEAD